MNGEGVTYTVKELISMLEEKLVEQIGSIVQQLDKIDAKLDDKVSLGTFRDLEARFESFKDRSDDRIGRLERAADVAAAASRSGRALQGFAIAIVGSAIGALIYLAAQGVH